MKLYNADCLEVLHTLPKGSIDLILTDLPYGTTQNKWDLPLDLGALWEAYDHVLKDNGAVLLFAQQPFASDLVQSKRKWFRYEWVWVKSAAGGFLNANRMPLRAHELVLVFYRKLPTYNQQRRTGFASYVCKQGPQSSNYRGMRGAVSVVQDGSRCPIDVISFNVDRGGHPTQKPVALCEYLIKTYSNAGELVLDSCMGSGTTGVAALNTGRDFIGIELNKEYFELAKGRIEANRGFVFE